MKKGLTAIILAFTLAVCTVAFSACVSGVSGESDLYGSYFTEDYKRCITLGEENLAVVEYGSKSEIYYARYDLMHGRIEFRLGDYWGDVAYTVTVKDADTLELEYKHNDVDENGNTVTVTEDPIVFVRDSYYDPAAEA